mmetsp:Transcript_76978/g.174060  ORF Transcript_76978/g.174060 Transcript_76978/m.174060 type:complete len:479 (+) Transcript_76978:109-1545(+)
MREVQRTEQTLAPRTLAVALVCACVSVYMLGGSIRVFPLRPPRFDQQVADGSRMANIWYEVHEQAALLDGWMQQLDTGVNIGVWVGTSCVFLDKLLEQTSVTPGLRTLCVEPNDKILTTLRTNVRQNTEPNRVKVLHGIAADSTSCPSGATVFDGGDEGKQSFSSLSANMTWTGMGDSDVTDSFTIKACFSMRHMEFLLGQKPSVIFVDCDGCLPDVFEQFKSEFAHPSVKLLAYEREARPGSPEPEYWWEAKWHKMEVSLLEQGWTPLKCHPNSLWGVWVWSKGGPRFEVHVWCIVAWLLCFILLTRMVDAVARLCLHRCLGLSLAVAPPFWRLLVLFLWHHCIPKERFGKTWPYNFLEPITGLECTWACISERVGQAMSNYAYLYIAVTWPAVRLIFQTTTQSIMGFCFLVQTASILGFVLAAVLRSNSLAPLCKGPQPQQRIWEMNVVATLLFCMLTFPRTSHRKTSQTKVQDNA